MKSVDIGNDFFHRLANRNRFQGDGKYNAQDFRKKYLSHLVANNEWAPPKETLVLDFTKVNKIGPSFANKAFAYFMKWTNPDDFFKSVKLENISNVQKQIIVTELKSGYSK